MTAAAALFHLTLLAENVLAQTRFISLLTRNCHGRHANDQTKDQMSGEKGIMQTNYTESDDREQWFYS